VRRHLPGRERASTELAPPWPGESLPAVSDVPRIELALEPLPQSMRLPQTTGRLAGRVVVVTGADGAIGRAVAHACAREGADLALIAPEDGAELERTVREVESPERVLLRLAGDVGDESFARAAVARILARCETIDVLINATIARRACSSIEELTPAQFEATFRTNVLGTYQMTRAALPGLASRSAVVNTASVTAFGGDATLLDYSASAGAIVAFTRSLALQTAAQGVRVNAVAHGAVFTSQIASDYTADALVEFGRDVPMRRPAEPAEIANAYVFLACDEASYMTGQVLRVCGGPG